METNSINSFLVLITGDIDNFMYTYILVALLVFTGIYFTIRTKGVQFRYIKDMFTQLFEKLAAFALSTVMSFLGISNERFEGTLARSLPPLRKTII